MPRRRRQMGGAWYDSVWSGIKSVASKANDLAKSTKIASTLLDKAGYSGAAAVARQAGYAKRKRRRRPQLGGMVPFMAKV